MKHSIDNQLSVCVGDSDRIEHLGEVIRNQAVPGPLRKEGDRNDNTQTLQVALALDERFPPGSRRSGAIKLDGRFDLFELVLDKRILSGDRSIISCLG